MLREYAAQWVDMVPHLDTLHRLATGCGGIIEFGTRSGVSTWAFLDGLNPDGWLVSVDNDPMVEHLLPERVTKDPRWKLIIGDDRHVVIPWWADLVFIDTSHEYHHTLMELTRADGIRAKQIVLHDWNLPDVQDAVRGFVDRSAYRLTTLEPSQWGLAVLERT
jgi:predicted O-methyltransferase YrrM